MRRGRSLGCFFGLPDAVAPRQLLHALAGQHRCIVHLFRERFHILAPFDEEPLVVAIAKSYEIPLPFELLSMQNEVQLTVFELLLRRLAQWLECSSIPYHDRAAAILTLRYFALEIGVGYGMVFHADGKPLFAAGVGHPLGNCPRFERAPHFDAEVVVQAAGIVFLYDESVFRDLWPFRLWFSRVTEISLSSIFFERHKLIPTFRFSAKRFKAIKRQILSLTSDRQFSLHCSQILRDL